MNRVALTFDDGPNPETTEQILEVLKKENVKATFFMLGKNVGKYPQIVKKAKDENHEIETHGQTHFSLLSLLPPQKITSELKKSIAIIQETTGAKPAFFRPPHGFKTSWMTKAAAKLNLKTITWTIDTFDWKEKNPTKIIKRCQKAGGGDIILMHDTKEITTRTLPTIIKLLKAKGFKLVTLKEI